MQLLNGHMIRRQSSNRNEPKESINTLSQEDLESVAGLFDEVRELFRRAEYNLDNELSS